MIIPDKDLWLLRSRMASVMRKWVAENNVEKHFGKSQDLIEEALRIAMAECIPTMELTNENHIFPS